MDFGSLTIASNDADFSRGVTAQQLQFKEKPKIGTGMTHAVRIERSFPVGSAFSFSVHPTTPHQHVDADRGQSRDYHPAVLHVDRGVTLRLTRATLETHPGDYGSCGTLSFASDDNEDYLTLCDFHKPNEERVMSSLGIEVSGPRSIRLGISHWRGTFFGVSINVFGSVVADGRLGPEIPGDEEKSEVVTKRRESDGHVVTGKAENTPDETSGEATEATATATPSEKQTEETKQSKKRKHGVSATEEVASSKDEGEEEETNSKQESDSAAASSSEPEKLSKKQRKKLAKKKAQELAEVVAKTEGHQGKEKPSQKKSEKKKAVPQTRERRLDGGVLVSDIIIGTGAAVRPGRKVAITYEGAFTDGKVFDKNKSKKHPLEFRPGTGEVIKGLERGLEGMKVGGERVITVPPELGYGKKGSGDVVPGNATLVFTVQLISVGGR